VWREDREGLDPGFEVRSWVLVLLVEGRVVEDEEDEYVVRFLGRDVDVEFWFVDGEFLRFTDEEADVRLEWDVDVGDCGVEFECECECDSAYPES